jgi:hypothetical protein
MKKCPFCAETIQDEAVKCRYCGEMVDSDTPQKVEYLSAPSAAEKAKLAEIRRLQRIASGRPTHADSTRKAKGILYLVIIAVILLYGYSWNRSRRAKGLATPAQTERISDISFEAFNAIYGPESVLTTEEKEVEFAVHKGKTVAWSGTVAYVNRAENGERYVSIRHRAATHTSDVLLRYPEKDRERFEALREGDRIRYRGKIEDYGEKTAFITLVDGAILSRN